MTLKSLVAVLCGILTFATAHAALTITNGDFEIGGGINVDNVTDWSDPSNGVFWQGSWVSNLAGQTPNGTNVVVLGSYEGGAIQNTTSLDPLEGNYLYQSVGFADGMTSVQIGFDFGAPDDDPGGRELGLTVALYAFDGIGDFIPDDSASIFLASLDSAGSGVTLLDSETFQVLSTGVDGQISSYVSTLNLIGAGSQEIFLSFNSYRPANTESWPVLDNVTIIPEPTALALGLFSIGSLLLVRRCRRS